MQSNAKHMHMYICIQLAFGTPRHRSLPYRCAQQLDISILPVLLWGLCLFLLHPRRLILLLRTTNMYAAAVVSGWLYDIHRLAVCCIHAHSNKWPQNKQWLAHHTCVTYLWPLSLFVEGAMAEQQYMAMPAWPEAYTANRHVCFDISSWMSVLLLQVLL